MMSGYDFLKRCRVYVTVGRRSVRPSVCLVDSQSAAATGSINAVITGGSEQSC